MQNGFAEGFNGTLRDRCLNEHWFTSIDDARERFGQWRQIYNTINPTARRVERLRRSLPLCVLASAETQNTNGD